MSARIIEFPADQAVTITKMLRKQGRLPMSEGCVLVLPVVRVDRFEDDGGAPTRFFNCGCSLGPIDLDALKEP